MINQQMNQLTSLLKNFRFLNLFLLVSISLILSNSILAQKAVPELWGIRVHDDAHALKQETVDQLEKELKTYEDSTSNQIAILIVQSLDGDVLEEYSLHVAEKWKLGTKNKDNGALLLIAVDDHKMRIEVGQGLESVLTDAQSNRIIRNEIAPEFRRGDYDAGVKAGINGIVKAIAGEYQTDGSESESSIDGTWIVVGILMGVFFIALLVFAFVKEFRSTGGVGSKTSRRHSSSPIGSSSFSGWSSSSSSGSSFSGGGGSFGGGGSSGGW